MVVELHPVHQPLPRLLERLEPGTLQELLLQRFPEPFDLSQRLRMLRGAANVVHVVLRQLFLKLRCPTPTGVLPPVVRQHLFRRPILPAGLPIGLDHVRTRVAPVQSQGRDVPGMIINEPDDVRHLPQDGIVRDVALPHPVRSRRLKPPFRRLHRPSGLPPLRLGSREPRPIQLPLHLRRRRFQEEDPPKNLRDPSHPVPRVLLLQRLNLLRHHPGQGLSCGA